MNKKTWNVKGINSDKKWNAIRDRVCESSCDIVCLQENKKESFDLMFIANICPPSFDKFEFLPSEEASGGSIVIWKSSTFQGQLVFHNAYALSH